MSLPSGTRLGTYEIASLLGSGSMGEVYRARDSRLNREVAIKVLPARLAGDAEYMARFEREAQVLASLNHPNIATVHFLEESGVICALVMELVEGPTLGSASKHTEVGGGSRSVPCNRSDLHEFVQLRSRYAAVEETEAACVFHFG